MYYGKSYERYRKDVQASHPRAYTMWTVPDEEKLHFMVSTGCYSVEMIGRVLQRQDSAIVCRLEKLGLPVPGQEKTTPKKLEKKFMVVGVDLGSGDILPISYSNNRDAAIKLALREDLDIDKLYLIESNAGIFDNDINVSEINSWSLKRVV
ncbi:hypothetical protein LCGC14_2558340 [marine sediment metagenome]|uniref:Uncharacterized protein n=1 Tax=marine sediment metagenome TaxID=412755 RepID=A0A0F9B8R3_9ZZZZ